MPTDKPAPTSEERRASEEPRNFRFGSAAFVSEIVGDLTSNRDIVFLHGWGGSRESLRGIATLFQGLYRVHLVDLPGFGDSPPPPDGWGTVDYTDLVEDYVQRMAPGRLVVVGHSFGARIAIRLAARHVSNLEFVALLSAPGLPSPSFSTISLRRAWIRSLRWFFHRVNRWTGPKLLTWHSRRFGSRDFIDAGVMRPVLVRVVNEDLTEFAKAVNCPTLLLWGADDSETPVALGRRFRALIGRAATLRILPHKDHHLYAGTGAHLCAFEIQTWLRANGEQ